MQRNSLFPSSPLTEEWKNFLAFLPSLENFPRKIWIAQSTALCPNEASSRTDVDVPCCKWPVVWHFYGYYSHYGDQVWITDLQPGIQSHSVASTFFFPLLCRSLMAGNFLLHISDIWGNFLKAVVANWTLVAMLSYRGSSCLVSLLS